jgi:catechol 2,3-dioxygenase-like lactoylglutathione lyase family enzyme
MTFTSSTAGCYARDTMRVRAAIIVLSIAAMSACGDRAKTPSENSGPSTSVIGGVYAVTIATSEPAAVRDYYAVFGLSARESRGTVVGDAAAHAALWGVSESVAASRFYLVNARENGAPMLRVIVVAPETPRVRNEYSARADGGASLGFACAASDDGSAAFVKKTGMQPASSFAVVVPRPDGAGNYTVSEAYFHAPENVLLPCVTRPADVAPIAPIDAGLAVGGPAYVGLSVVGVDAEIAFYERVLGLEKRRDILLTDGKLLAAAGLPAGAQARFVQMFAPGTPTGNLTLVDLGDKGERNSNTRPPARGINMVTFRVRDVLDVRRRLKDAQGVVVAGPMAAQSAELGPYTAMTALSPAGTFLEFIETSTAR